MKKWKFLFAALMMSTAVFVSSCGDDGSETDPGPSLTLKGGTGYTSVDATIETGTTIKVGVIGGKSSVSGNKLTHFKCVFTSNNVPTTLLDSTLNSDTFDWEIELEFNSTGTGIISFELTDKGGMKTDKSFNITVQGKKVKKYVNVGLGSYNDDSKGSFFASTTGGTFNVPTAAGDASIQSKIDFLFFKGTGTQNNQNTFASPDDVDANTIATFRLNEWTNTNQTRFNPTTITAAQFDAIGDNYDFPIFNTNLQTTKMSETYQSITEGSVFLFKTQAGKLGLVKVIDFYSRGDLATFSVIVEE